MSKKFNPGIALAGIVILLWVAGSMMGQLQQSGGSGTSTTLLAGSALVGKVGLDQTTPGTTNAMSIAQIGSGTVATAATGIMKVGMTDGTGTAINSTGNALNVSANITGGSIGNTAFALNAGSAIIGFVRLLPPGCASLTTLFANSTAQVVTGAGTTVTSTTTCVTSAFANNITNSAVTLRLADKQGTPVIWFGGNADFSIPANSNMKIPIEGVTFTSGITAIAGTTTALNLQINGLQ
jgi:hypothetical protein